MLRRRKPIDRRKADGRRNDNRDVVAVLLFVLLLSLLLSPSLSVYLLVVVIEGSRPSSVSRAKWWVGVGASKSESDPANNLATVDVRAIVVTCVEGKPAGDDDDAYEKNE